MKNYTFFSEGFIKHLMICLKTLITELLKSEFTFNRKQLMTEAEVAHYLQVSERTMRTYRAQNHFHYIKLEGRIYYLSIIFYFDLIILSFTSKP